jgi:DNA-binding transcriptional MerR regulator
MSNEEVVLRPIDLARPAGISTQQVRNYLDAGILPPAQRSPAGYRRFGERHRRALFTYRKLGKGYGWDVARAMMHAVHAGEVPAAVVLLNAGHAALHEQRLSLKEAARALEAVAESDLDTSAIPRSGMRIGEVAGYLGVRSSALRVWESAGLLEPKRDAHGYRSFGVADVRDAQLINMLRRGRYPLPQVKSIMDSFRKTGSADALRAAIARRNEELAQRAMAMLEASCFLYHYISDRPLPAEQ